MTFESYGFLASAVHGSSNSFEILIFKIQTTILSIFIVIRNFMELNARDYYLSGG